MVDKELTVRVIVGALLLGLASLAGGQTSLLSPESLPRVVPSGARPATYGTAQTSYLTIFDSQFGPFNSGVTYDDLGNGAAKASRFATGGVAIFLAPVNLPDGALVMNLEMDACDSNGGGNHVVGVLGACDSFGINCVAIGSPISSVSNPASPCAPFGEDLSSLNYTVNNLTGRLFLEILTQSGDNTNSISGALIGYKLQVSPAPVTATFNDVPTSDFAFQFIEAFNAAGITVGCNVSPPQFCPDRNVTRREMAVFFAKALGLQSP